MSLNEPFERGDELLVVLRSQFAADLNLEDFSIVGFI